MPHDQGRRTRRSSTFSITVDHHALIAPAASTLALTHPISGSSTAPTPTRDANHGLPATASKDNDEHLSCTGSALISFFH